MPKKLREKELESLISKLSDLDKLSDREKAYLLKEVLSRSSERDPIPIALLIAIGIFLLRAAIVVILLGALKTYYSDETGLGDKFRAIADGALERVMIPIETLKTIVVKPTIKRDIPEPKVLLPFARFQFTTLVAMTILGQIVSAFSRIGLGQIGAWFYEFAGFRHVTRAFIGSLIYAAHTRPLRYAWNLKFQTALPHPVSASYMYARRRITDEEYKRYLRMQGIVPELIKAMLWIARRPLDPFSFAFLAQTGYWEDKEWRRITEDMGYHDHVMDYLTKAPMMWGLSPFKTTIRKNLVTAYAEGYATLAYVVREIVSIWRILDLTTMVKLEAESKYKAEVIKEKVDMIGDKFYKDIISESEARRMLKNYIIDPLRLNDYIERIKIKKFRKPREETLPEQKRFVRAVLSDAYEIGIIGQPEFRRRMEEADRINEPISLFLYRAQLERWLKEEKEKMAEVKKKVKEYIGVVAGTLITLYQEGHLTKDELERELAKAERITDKKMAYVMKAEWARFLELKREEAKKDKEDTREYLSLLASSLISLYELGYLTKNELDSELERSKRIVEKKAAYLLKAEYERLKEEIKAKEKLLKEKLEQRIIHEGTFMAELGKLGALEWKIELLIEEYEIKAYGRETKIEEKRLRRYRTIKKRLNECLEAGFLTPEQVEREAEEAWRIIDPTLMLRRQVYWDIFYDDKKIALDEITELFRATLVTEAQFFDKLKEIIIVPEKRYIYFEKVAK